MDIETLAHAFEPFFTRKEFGKGSGLGLSMVYAFAQQSNGSIQIDSQVTCGTTFTLLLPEADTRIDQSTQFEELPEFIDLPQKGTLVLLVEDEREVRRVIRRQLQGINCLVLESSNGSEGLRHLALAPDISILMTDIVMPGAMSGLDLARRAIEVRPDLKIILMSGYAEVAEQLQAEILGWPVLQKPFSPKSILRALRTTR